MHAVLHPSYVAELVILLGPDVHGLGQSRPLRQAPPLMQAILLSSHFAGLIIFVASDVLVESILEGLLHNRCSASHIMDWDFTVG